MSSWGPSPARLKTLNSSSVREIAIIPFCEFVPFRFGDCKPRRTAIHTKRNLRENQDCGEIKTLHSRKMDVHLSSKLPLIGIADRTGETTPVPPLRKNVATLYAMRSRLGILQNNYDRMRRAPGASTASLELRLLLVEKSRWC